MRAYKSIWLFTVQLRVCEKHDEQEESATGIPKRGNNRLSCWYVGQYRLALLTVISRIVVFLNENSLKINLQREQHILQ